MLLLPEPSDRVALIDEERHYTYSDLHEKVQARIEELTGEPGLLFLFTANNVDALVTYLAAFEMGRPVALLDQALKHEFALNLIELYQPAYISGFKQVESLTGYREAGPDLWRADHGPKTEIYEGLAVLLSTSGSTGTPKFVRLHRDSVLHNASAIAESLDISASDRAITSLPFHYSFGLSVVNSHLVSGGSLVVTERSILEPQFWQMLESHEVTSLSGVPFTYQMLDRIGWHRKRVGSLEKMTQAGGKLATELKRKVHQQCLDLGIDFYVMYGQTEAAPRISCVPASRLGEKITSAGKSLRDGELSIQLPDGSQTTAPDQTGEVIYRGPNVMLGYAERRGDLALGDTLNGRLETGDLGHLDAEGYLYITGRARRIAKIYGVRVNLDEIESLLTTLNHPAVIEHGDALHVFHQPSADAEAARTQLAADLRVPQQAIVFHELDQIPISANQKPDYPKMLGLLQEGT